MTEQSTQSAKTKAPEKLTTVSRVYDASPARVFEAWTKPEQLARWWGPNQFTLPECTVDFRVGGAFRMVMRGFGQDHGFGGVYREIVPGKRLVFTSVIDGSPDHEMMTTVTFEALADGKTKLTVTQTAPENEMHARGQKQGWSESLEKLAGALAGANDEH
jgi:uncharacterized protein YndB with AHSA1/START domain